MCDKLACLHPPSLPPHYLFLLASATTTTRAHTHALFPLHPYPSHPSPLASHLLHTSLQPAAAAHLCDTSAAEQTSSGTSSQENTCCWWWG